MSTQKITNDNTSLLAAVKSNSDLKTLEYLISQGAEVNAKDKNGKIPAGFCQH
ncbi:MAG: ankyrin repeat domain-containing protein [Planctomycetaceae bacterium]|jgi:ankyrin repeat protein|nr:ankyrin repeat domain-containing protein [Planctomycetaceae bacterium]